MLKLSLESLLNHVKEKGHSALLQEETQQVYLSFKVENNEFPLFIRIVDQETLIQLIAFFPCTIKPNAVANVARTLHLLNKEIDVPGLGMDEENGLIFLRYMLNAADGEISEALLDKYVEAIQAICKTFFPLILGVSQNALSFEDVARKIRTTLKANQK